MEKRDTYLLICAFLFGAILTFFMINRAQISGDQLNLLARGYLFAAQGHIVPYGNPMSGGGNLPGTFTSIAIGTPLTIWFDHRAPSLSLWFLHIASFFLMYQALKDFLTKKGQLYFCLLYWLSPWHIFFSVVLWNPTYMYFFTALHFWTLTRLRQNPTYFISLLHFLSIGLAAQLHASAFILALHTLFLLYFRYITINWRGAASALVLFFITIAPWIPIALNQPDILPASKDGRFIGRGLLYVFPLLRGVLYALKLPTFYTYGKIYRFDFESVFGDAGDAILTPLVKTLSILLGCATLALSCFACYWFYKSFCNKRILTQKYSASDSNDWFKGVIFFGHLGILLSFSLSPTTINPWQVLPAHYLMALPIVLFLEHETDRISNLYLFLRRWSPAYLICGAVILISVGIASPYYRKGGRGYTGIPLRNYHPMLDELHLTRDFDLTVTKDGTGWWVDVLPDANPLPSKDSSWVGKPWDHPDWKK